MVRCFLAYILAVWLIWLCTLARQTTPRWIWGKFSLARFLKLKAHHNLKLVREISFYLVCDLFIEDKFGSGSVIWKQLVMVENLRLVKLRAKLNFYPLFDFVNLFYLHIIKFSTPYRFVFFTTRFGFFAAISTANMVKRTGLSSRRKNYRFCGERLWYVLVSACACYKKWTRDTTRIKLINPKHAIFLADIFVTSPLCPGYYRLSTHCNVGSHEYPGTRLVASFTLYYIQ